MYASFVRASKIGLVICLKTLQVVSNLQRVGAVGKKFKFTRRRGIRDWENFGTFLGWFLIFRTFWKSMNLPLGPISEHFEFFWKNLGSNFWFCNSDFFDFGAYPPAPFGTSSQIYLMFGFDVFPEESLKKTEIVLRFTKARIGNFQFFPWHFSDFFLS